MPRRSQQTREPTDPSWKRKRPGRTPAPRRARAYPHWAAALLLTALLAPAARAHSVATCRGELLVQPDRLQAELTIPASDLVHCVNPPRTVPAALAWDVLDACALAYADQLADEFVIRTEAGERLPATFVSVTHDFTDRATHDLFALQAARVTYRFDYAPAAAPRFLTFQQYFFNHGAAHAAQLALAVRTAAHQPACTVQLSNRGNTETVRIDNAPGGAPGPVHQPAEFRELRADVTINSTGVHIEISMPLGVFETWSPAARSDLDFLNPAEQSAVRAAATQLLAGGNVVRIDGVLMTPRMASVRLVGPAHETVERLFTGSACILATLEYAANDPQEVKLTWTLFNNAVLLARVTLRALDGEHHYELNPTTPDISWTARPNRAVPAQNPRSDRTACNPGTAPTPGS